MAFTNTKEKELYKQLHIDLICLCPFSVYEKNCLSDLKTSSFSILAEPVSLILSGKSDEVLELPIFDNIIPKIMDIDSKSGALLFLATLVDNLKSTVTDLPETSACLQLIYAIALGQCFIQENFTGPSVKGNKVIANLRSSQVILDLLEVQGLSVYELCEYPILILMCLKVLEYLTRSESWSLLKGPPESVEAISDEVSSSVGSLLESDCYASIAACWWRSRFLQVQMSLFHESSSIISSVSSIFMSPKILNALNKNDFVLSTLFYLESARNALHAELENHVLAALNKAREFSGLQLVLTGAKAKRTKFQQKSTASLLLLAKSKFDSLWIDDAQQSSADKIETKDLTSDILLEVPEYQSLSEQAVSEIHDTDEIQSGKTLKRIKLSKDFEDSLDKEVSPITDSSTDSLLPTAVKLDAIPESLKKLDPNNQPHLNDLDSIQLLLRLNTLRQTSPSGSHLVEEQLLALVSRVIANNTDSTSINYLVFSKALWERSVIEATRAKTIERGIFQMQALVEELNSKIQTKLFSESKETTSFDSSISANRLRFINQLPLSPRWALDVQLAEKFMSIGVMKSALEIYTRLGMISDMAVCYSAIGDETQAIKVLETRLKTHPDDARSLSILGSLTQNPSLWEKAWSTKKYANAKVSLARYYYTKKHESSKNIDLAIHHMNEVLTLNPISFQNWYFYGCLGLEAEQYELAAEAFTRCVSIDNSHNHSWSNLGSALLSLNRAKEAVSAYQNAIKTSESSSWRIWENYLVACTKVGDWNQVVHAAKQLLAFKDDESAIKLDIVQTLVAKLIEEDYDESNLMFFQKQCLDYLCVQIPKVNKSNSKLYKIQSRVELWAKRPWNSLSCMEKAYRVDINHPDLLTSEKVWNEAVETCLDLVSSYESLGEMEGKFGAEDLVCKDWKFKARTCIRSLKSKGRISWEDSKGWDRLTEWKC